MTGDQKRVYREKPEGNFWMVGVLTSNISVQTHSSNIVIPLVLVSALLDNVLWSEVGRGSLPIVRIQDSGERTVACQ